MLSAEPQSGSGWIHEIKHDGFRTLIRTAGKDVPAYTRSVRCRLALIDGEIIVQEKKASRTSPLCALQ
jgi:hypothetical protein